MALESDTYILALLAAKEAAKKAARDNMEAAAKTLAEAGIVMGTAISTLPQQRVACIAIRPTANPDIAIILRSSPNPVRVGRLRVTSEQVGFLSLGSLITRDNGFTAINSIREPQMIALAAPNTQEGFVEIIKTVIEQGQLAQA